MTNPHVHNRRDGRRPSHPRLRLPLHMYDLSGCAVRESGRRPPTSTSPGSIAIASGEKTRGYHSATTGPSGVLRRPTWTSMRKWNRNVQTEMINIAQEGRSSSCLLFVVNQRSKLHTYRAEVPVLHTPVEVSFSITCRFVDGQGKRGNARAPHQNE